MLIARTQSQLGKAEEQIEALKYAMAQLVKAHATHEPVKQPTMDVSRCTMHKPSKSVPGKRSNKSSFTEQAAPPSNNPQTATPEKGDGNTLDRQLRELTHEKEQVYFFLVLKKTALII